MPCSRAQATPANRSDSDPFVRDQFSRKRNSVTPVSFIPAGIVANNRPKQSLLDTQLCFFPMWAAIRSWVHAHSAKRRATSWSRWASAPSLSFCRFA
jgi:hypothetical protein